jgi:hypothetical protein
VAAELAHPWASGHFLECGVDSSHEEVGSVNMAPDKRLRIRQVRDKMDAVA